MLRYIAFIPLFWLPSLLANVDSILSDRCLATFEFIETQNLDYFIAEMPFTPSETEKARSAKVLQRAHQKWFVKEKINNIELGEITYQQASVAKQDKYGALNQARVKLTVVGDNYNSRVSCKFIQTENGWFLSSLP
ncbi:hypothetical protein GCM10009347_42280 [Shewanella algicola]|uniref:Uncharacterized protein n=1 Tax=Shewanella algicola TaxID=640633 RepID=A0A9X1Z7G7_9GAMM|nr:hypothetical protein [Shewanella algicola]MCL1107826.1 hypothetical protein [Shewanella algicola]GGP73426.1 hypothetical protein GCM10009347_42280 [Shewanella algicola]